MPYPSCLQTALVLLEYQRSSHTEPHKLFRQISTLPTYWFWPSTSLTAPSRQLVLVTAMTNSNIICMTYYKLLCCIGTLTSGPCIGIVRTVAVFDMDAVQKRGFGTNTMKTITHWPCSLAKICRRECKWSWKSAQVTITISLSNIILTNTSCSYKPQLPADHLSIKKSPEIITYCAPHTTQAYLNSPFMISCPSHQPHVTFSCTKFWNNNNYQNLFTQ